MTTEIQWQQLQTFMFDMDGTLLDLAFDNFFWRELVIRAWAEQQGLDLVSAQHTLQPIFRAQEGSLNWYSLPYWSDQLNLDLQQLKHEHRARIAIRHDVEVVLETILSAGKTLWLVTNAHPHALEIKLEQTGLARYFHEIITSHDYGYAKEQAPFWQALQQDKPFEPQASLLIDDSESVLHAASAFGLHVLGIVQPDSTLPKRADLYFPALDRWSSFIDQMN